MADRNTVSATQEFINKIASPDETTNGVAAERAFLQGAPAIKPLAELLSAKDFELARRAKRALYTIVRHATRPGAHTEAKAVETELGSALREGTSPSTRRQLLWMLSEIGHDQSVLVIAPFLADPDVREDARCVLIRIPGERAMAALRTALASAPADFAPALQDALTKRAKRLPTS